MTGTYLYASQSASTPTSKGTSMLVLHILSTVILLCLAWDVHRGTKEIIATAEDIHRTTDELLRRVPPTP